MDRQQNIKYKSKWQVNFQNHSNCTTKKKLFFFVNTIFFILRQEM